MAIDVVGLSPMLEVFDMPTSIAFYCGTLGFEILKTSAPGPDFDWAWLRLGNAELMLNTAYESEERPGEPEPGRAAGHSDVTIYFGCPDVDGTYSLLRARGVDVRPPVVRPYGMKQLSLVDPDGFRICFQWTA